MPGRKRGGENGESGEPGVVASGEAGAAGSGTIAAGDPPPTGSEPEA
jgi:hypothetical protein